MTRLALAFASLAAAPAAFAETAPYAGQQERAVSSLSAEDLAALRRGAGWGLAKPAELNGWPGPSHVLDAADALALTPAQKEKIEAIFAAMQEAAVDAGARYIEAEAALDAAFREGDATPGRIAELTNAAGAARAALQAVHLTAHAQTAPLLTRHQKMVYARLRGYEAGDADGQGAHAKH